MIIKYRELMKELNLTFESEVLDKGFVSKAKAFEAKMEAGQLSDQEIEAEDAELVKLFNETVTITEEDSEEVKRANQRAALADAKAEIAAAETIPDLEGLRTKFSADVPEVLAIIDKKIAKLADAAAAQAEKENKEKQAKFISEAKQYIKDAKDQELQALLETYKDYPELLELINKRIGAIVPPDKDKELADTLRSQKEWGYKELIVLGVKPTGNDMTIAGVRLEKEYLFNIYSVRK